MAAATGREVMIVSCKVPNKCWTLTDGKTHNGCDICLWDIREPGHVDHLNCVFLFDGNTFRPKKNPGKSIHVALKGTANGTGIHLWDLRNEGHKPSSFRVEGKSIYSNHAPNKCLRLRQNKATNGTLIELWSGENINSHWEIRDVQSKKKGIEDLKMSMKLLFANTGGNQKGQFVKKVEVSRGFKSDFEIGTEFEVAMEASLGGPLKVFSDVKGSMKAQFKANAKFSYEEHETDFEEFTVDLSAPMYIYQLGITGTWGSKTFSGHGGFFVTDELMPEQD